MRILAVCAVTLLMLGASSAGAAELPRRKPGHWQLTTVAPATGMTTIDVCVGERDNIALPADSGDCAEPKVTAAGDEVIIDVVCKKPHGKQIMSTVFSGDFEKHYRAIMKMTFDPPEGYKTMGVTIDGRYIGAKCPLAATAPEKTGKGAG